MCNCRQCNTTEEEVAAFYAAEAMDRECGPEMASQNLVEQPMDLDEDLYLEGFTPQILDAEPTRLQLALQMALRVSAGLASQYRGGGVPEDFADFLCVAARVSDDDNVVVPLIDLLGIVEGDFFGEWGEPVLPRARFASRDLRAIAARASALADRLDEGIASGEWPEEYEEPDLDADHT